LFLAIYFWLRGGSLFPGILRLIISFSFAALGWMQLKVSAKDD
jgi:hypothetical protein